MFRKLRYFFLKSIDSKTQTLIRVAITGVIIGTVAVAFRYASEELSHYFFKHSLYKDHWYEWFYPVLICCFGGWFASYITVKFAPDASGSGIPQVKYSLNGNSAIVSAKTAIIKFFGAVVAIGSGLSLGREGPTIHIGAGLGANVGKALGSKNIRRSMASGAGAGLAAAFNTPIAGVLFIIEELDNTFSNISLGPAIVGSVSAAITCRVLYGDFFTFHFQSDTDINLLNFPLYIVLGILCGIAGVFFQRSILGAMNFYTKVLSFIPRSAHGAIAGLLTGLCALWLPEAVGGGHDTLEGTLAQAYVWWTIIIIFFFKYLLTILAYGSGVPGGIFAPSLILGALLGASFGNLTNYLLPMDIDPSTFAFIGMGAFFTGLCRAPITGIVMLFELTGNYDLVIPLMFACIIANITAEKMHFGGIYESLLDRQGLKLRAHRTPSYLQHYTVSEVMQSKVETMKFSITISKALAIFEESHHTAFPVVNDENQLVGIVSKNDVKKALVDLDFDESDRVSDIMTEHPKFIFGEENLQSAILLLYEHNIGRLVVVKRNDPGVIVGILTRSDIIHFEANKELD